MRKIALSLFLTITLASPAYSQEAGVLLSQLRDRYGVTSEIENFNTMCNLLCISDEYARSIGLTEVQIFKIKPLYVEMEKNTAKIKEELIAFELLVSEVMNNKDFDLDKANIICQKITHAKMLHQLQVLKYIKEIRSILTTEQFMNLNMKISVYSGRNLTEKLLSNKASDIMYSQK